MLYMIFHSGQEPVLIQRIVIGFENHTGKYLTEISVTEMQISFAKKIKNIFSCFVARRSLPESKLRIIKLNLE